MRLPKGFKIISETADSKHIIIENYDGNFLAFQIIVLALPLLIASVLLVGNLGMPFFIVFGLFLAVVYWCLYNYKDRTQFLFTKDYFIVKEGMHQLVKLNVHKNDVIDTQKIDHVGSSITPGFTNSSRKTRCTYELYIITKDDKILVTKHVGSTGQAFLKDSIEKWIGR